MNNKLSDSTNQPPIKPQQNILLNDLDQFLIGLADGYEHNHTGELIKVCRLDGTQFAQDGMNLYTYYKQHPINIFNIPEMEKLLNLLEITIESFGNFKKDCLDPNPNGNLTQIYKDLKLLSLNLQKY